MSVDPVRLMHQQYLARLQRERDLAEDPYAAAEAALEKIL